MPKAEVKDYRQEYHDFWAMDEPIFEKGDIVTREGRDEQIILDIDYGGGMLAVEVLNPNGVEWCVKGEREDNLIRRYSFVRKREDNAIK